MKIYICLLLIFSFTGHPGLADDASAPMTPRIRIHNGHFVQGEATRLFHPVGFNYIRLDPRWHSTFRPDRYDAERADRALEHMASAGFNTVRVFLDPFTGRGLVESRQSTTLSARYVANLCDFLQRAREHRLYVIVSVLHLPESKRYRTSSDDPPDHVGDRNRHVLSEQGIEAKALYMSDVVKAVRDHDPSLLSTVLAYETDNELTLRADEPPFAKTQGVIHAGNGESYNADSVDDLQQLADDYTVLYANACSRAIKAVDPEALVSINVFTYAAVGRSGPAKWHVDSTRDGRIPVRPLALIRSEIDYLDVHFYPFGPQTLSRDLSSIEWDDLRPAAAKAGKPIIMGEFGAFKNNYKTEDVAVEAMSRHVQRVTDLGFAGWLYWTYDCHEQKHLWHARSESGDRIFSMLAERVADLR